MKPEAKFKEWLRNRMPGHWQSLEALNAPGLPDVNICHQGLEVWLELKSGIETLIRPSQYAWGMKRSHPLVGGRCFVVTNNTLFDRIIVLKYPFRVYPNGKYVKPHPEMEPHIFQKSEINLLCSLLFDHPRLQ